MKLQQNLSNNINLIKIIVVVSLLIAMLYSARNYRMLESNGTNLGDEISIKINEVMASNRSTPTDYQNDFFDWIELYNFGDSIQNLSGLHLSDTIDNIFKWKIPDGTLIGPGEYKLIYASGNNLVDINENLHTNFRISKYGEEVFLSDFISGEIIDRSIKTNVPSDMSLGRYPDGGNNWVLFMQDHTTPGEKNSDVLPENIKIIPPIFSADTGIYSKPFDLSLNSVSEKTTIYYTVDGSIPDFLDNKQTNKYRSPISIIKNIDNPLSYIKTSPYWSPPGINLVRGSVVRAIAIRDGFLASETITKTFIIEENNMLHDEIPVIFISTDSVNLFDYDRGIYVPGAVYDENFDSSLDGWQIPGNYSLRGLESEIPIHFTIFKSNLGEIISINAGLRIHGGATRSFAQKSLRIYARSKYDINNWMNGEIFQELLGKGTKSPVTAFKRIILRNSGNDFTSTMFRDAMMQNLVKTLNIDTQAYQPAIVYLNGEYWGIHNLRERFDRFYLQSHYDLDPNEVIILEGTGSVVEGNPKDNIHYLEMLEFIRSSDMTDNKNYQHINSLMDMDNYIDYIVSQIYFDNSDWPNNNTKFWRYDTDYYNPQSEYGLDGRWRWMLFDTDFGFGIYSGSDGFSANTLLNAVSKNESSELLIGLLRNPDFKESLINAFSHHLNTIFKPENVLTTIDEMSETLRPHMYNHILRWRLHSGNLNNWDIEVSKMQQFALLRPDALRNHISNFFDLNNGLGAVKIDIKNLSDGKILINNKIINEFPWRGEYFKDLAVKFETIPEEDSKFLRWIVKNGIIESGKETDLFIYVRIGENTVVEAAYDFQ